MAIPKELFYHQFPNDKVAARGEFVLCWSIARLFPPLYRPKEGFPVLKLPQAEDKDTKIPGYLESITIITIIVPTFLTRHKPGRSPLTRLSGSVDLFQCVSAGVNLTSKGGF